MAKKSSALETAITNLLNKGENGSSILSFNFGGTSQPTQPTEKVLTEEQKQKRTIIIMGGLFAALIILLIVLSKMR